MIVKIAEAGAISKAKHKKLVLEQDFLTHINRYIMIGFEMAAQGGR